MMSEAFIFVKIERANEHYTTSSLLPFLDIPHNTLDGNQGDSCSRMAGGLSYKSSTLPVRYTVQNMLG